MLLVSSCSCLCPIQWTQVLRQEWRCSWSSADRRCSNYIWVIDNFITTKVRLILETWWYISITKPQWVKRSMKPINTLRPRQNDCHFADNNLKCIFLKENVWISINFSLKFVPGREIDNIPALVQIMAWCRPGDKLLSEPMLVRLLMHICVTQPHSMRYRYARQICFIQNSWKFWNKYIQGYYRNVGNSKGTLDMWAIQHVCPQKSSAMLNMHCMWRL